MHPSLLGSVDILASSLIEWLSSLWALMLMVIGFGVVVFVHELGHFVMAKLAGVRVDKFAIGFGKELLGWTVGETRYAVNALPLGGYVKMLGQEDFTVDKSGEWKVKEDPRAFTNKSVGARMLIVSAGVVMNLVFAALAFMVVFMIGIDTLPPVIGQVVPGSPAQKAGLMPGDRILEVNGDRMHDYPDVKSSIILADVDRKITLKVQRPGRSQPVEIPLEPEWSEEEKVRQIGIYPEMTLQVGAVEYESDLDEQREDRLHIGDTVVEVNGTKVDNQDQVERMITAERGKYVKLLVRRPVDLKKPDGATREVSVLHRCRMLVLPTDGSGISGNILGLQARQKLLRVMPGDPADVAGLRAGDVIVKWGDHWNPTEVECNTMLSSKDDRGQYVYAHRGFEVIVRRVGMNKEIGVRPDRPTGTILSYSMVAPVLEKRDSLTELAYRDCAAATAEILTILKEAKADPIVLNEVRTDLMRRGASAADLSRWLADLDCETFTLHPAVSMWGNSPPRVGVMFGGLEIDRLVVSRTVEKGVEDRPTPASSMRLPRGALIKRVNDQPVKTWLELVDAFRLNAGRVVSIHFVHEGTFGERKMRVPQSLSDALNLPPTARVVRIAGQEKATLKRDGQTQPVGLPAWEAVYEILKAHRGESVKVVYQYMDKEISTDANGKELSYAVTDENDDPWLMRVYYTTLIIPQPQHMLLQNRNPVVAMWMGFKKTLYFILQAYKTMQHMIITGKVGYQHVSGPVGIFRYGTEVAQSGLTKLLYFLAFISANLAVINFLPLPIVDGGLVVFLLIEKIRGRPVSVKMQVITQVIGLVLIIAAFILVTFMDVSKWVTQG